MKVRRRRTAAQRRLRAVAAFGAAVAAVVALAMAVTAGVAMARPTPAGGEIAEGAGQRPVGPLGR